MTRRALLVCPGRGSYLKPELGYLARHHAGDPLLAAFDSARLAEGETPLTTLDAAARYGVATYSRGDVASPLIHACAFLDARTLAEDIEIAAVTGNSMGWYTALSVAGALAPQDGFTLVDTMGRLMQAHPEGGQTVYPHVGPDWVPDPARKARLLRLAAEIDARAGQTLRLSIDLGGLLVFAGNAAGLAAFEAAVPPLQGRYPMRLTNHGAFHTSLMAGVSALGREQLGPALFAQPALPLIDGRGAIWWPHATDTQALHAYTLGTQVTQSYDFTGAITVGIREFAPDLVILTGPGDSLGSAIAQVMIAAGWRGLANKADFQRLQAEAMVLVAMGRPDQRRHVT